MASSTGASLVTDAQRPANRNQNSGSFIAPEFSALADISVV